MDLEVRPMCEKSNALTIGPLGLTEAFGVKLRPVQFKCYVSFRSLNPEDLLL